MKTFVCTNFPGVNPIGTAAVIVATDVLAATQALKESLKKAGRPVKRGRVLTLTEVDTTIPSVNILRDGDY